MAKRKGMKMQPAITDLAFTIPAGTALLPQENRNYVDTAKQLSKVNRRLYSQSRMYGFQGLTFIWKSAAAVVDQILTSIECTVNTAGNTWVVQNSHTKGKALWHQMQDLVLDDNPSIAGKWHDYKIGLVSSQTLARTLEARDGQGVLYLDGEWNLSTYVMPQHQVSDGVTPDPNNPVPGTILPMGVPLTADEFSALLIGDHTASKKSLVKAYQESRATVFANAPNVPAGMSDSFFNLLTDSGSQEPELADVIEGENDNPPYNIISYPGTGTNAVNPVTVGYGAISSAEVDGRIGGFVAPCGLIEIEINGFDQDGLPFPAADMPAIDLLLHVAPGSYKGVASIPMGQ